MPNTAHITALLSRSQAALLAAANSVPEQAWRNSPAPGAWSAGEVLAHLAMAEEAIIGGVERIIASPPVPLPFWKSIHLSPRLAQFRQVKRQSPIPLDPTLVLDKAESIARHTALRGRSLELFAKNSGRDLAAYRVKHPFFGYLNFYQWFATIGYHELRHTQQIQEIVEVFQK